MSGKYYLETARLRLRRFTEADAEWLYALDSDPEVMRYINGGQTTPFDAICEQVLPRWLTCYAVYTHFGKYAALERSSGDFVGWFQFEPAVNNPYLEEMQLLQADDIALGYRLRRACWGCGYATEMAQALVRQGFMRYHVRRIVAWALAANVASTRVMEKAGLRRERTFVFPEQQLPLLSAAERKAVLYSLNSADYSCSHYLEGEDS